MLSRNTASDLLEIAAPESEELSPLAARDKGLNGWQTLALDLLFVITVDRKEAAFAFVEKLVAHMLHFPLDGTVCFM